MLALEKRPTEQADQVREVPGVVGLSVEISGVVKRITSGIHMRVAALFFPGRLKTTQ